MYGELPKLKDYLSIFVIGSGCLLLIYYELYGKKQNNNDNED